MISRNLTGILRKHGRISGLGSTTWKTIWVVSLLIFRILISKKLLIIRSTSNPRRQWLGILTVETITRRTGLAATKRRVSRYYASESFHKHTILIMPTLECHGDILKYYVAMDCIAKKAQKAHVCLLLFSRSGRLSDKPHTWFHQVSSTLWASCPVYGYYLLCPITTKTFQSHGLRLYRFPAPKSSGSLSIFSWVDRTWAPGKIFFFFRYNGFYFWHTCGKSIDLLG